MWQRWCSIALGTGISVYFAFSLLLYWGQNRLIFLPQRQISSTPDKFGLEYRDIWINIQQEKIHGWWIPQKEESAPVLLHFHGNASNNGDVLDNALIFNKLGLSVLLVDYRGYGLSSPTFPNENRAYEDATAAWQYLTETRKIKPEQIFVCGHSLGGAIAIELARHNPQMAGLITEGTFTSIENMARLNSLFSLLPLNLIVHQRFDSIAKIDSLEVPLLMFHGMNDETIPFSMGEELFDRANEPKKFIPIAKAGHNNLHQIGRQEYIFHLQQFIDSYRSIP